MKKFKIVVTLCLVCMLFCPNNSSVQAKDEKVSITINDIENSENLTDLQWQSLEKTYKQVTKEKSIILALEFLKTGIGAYSRDAIMGANLTGKPIKIQFKNLAQINTSFADFDAAGSMVKEKLFININEKHRTAPPIALAALIAHEALHQDVYNSINEETYAWTMEAAVWTQLSEKYPDKVELGYPLVKREDMLKKLFIKGNYTDEYIRKSVRINPAYQNLPSRSPGFEDRL